tara:strand:+ start:1041 stop:1286 length:246 start_codon:yes stop_codon:yes gene_type:complete
MSEEVLTGFDLWTPNDYSNFITICAAAIGSTLLVLFKSRCSKITFCWGLYSCDREVASDSEEEDETIVPPPPPSGQTPPNP